VTVEPAAIATPAAGESAAKLKQIAVDAKRCERDSPDIGCEPHGGGHITATYYAIHCMYVRRPRRRSLIYNDGDLKLIS